MSFCPLINRRSGFICFSRVHITLADTQLHVQTMFSGFFIKRTLFSHCGAVGQHRWLWVQSTLGDRCFFLFDFLVYHRQTTALCFTKVKHEHVAENEMETYYLNTTSACPAICGKKLEAEKKYKSISIM